MARILIVDDQERIARSSAAYLEGLGHETVVSLTIACARERLSESEFDCLIVDVVLPDGNGLDLLAETLAERPGLQAIVITGHVHEEITERANRLGVERVLNKPFRNSDLAEQIESALSGGERG